MSNKKITTITLLANILSKLIFLAVLGYPARILGPESYGIVITAASIVAYAGILLWPGMSNWGAMEIARNPKRGDEVISSILLMRLILSVLGILIICAFIYKSQLSFLEKQAIYIYSFYLLSQALNIDWVFYGKEMSQYPAVINFAISFINIALILNLIKSSEDTLLYIAIIPCVLIIYSITLILLGLSRKKFKIITPRISICIDIFRNSFYLGISGVMIIILQYSINLFVRGNLNAESTGIFGAGFYYFQLTMLVPATLSSIMMGRFARISTQFPEKTCHEANKIFSLFAISGLAGAFCTYIFSTDLVRLIYGSSYMETAQLIRIMSAGILFNFSISAVVGFLSALDKGRAVLATVSISLITALLGGAILVPAFGLKGAAIAISLIDAAGFIFAVNFLIKFLPNFNLLDYRYPVILTIFTILLFHLLQKYFPHLISVLFSLALEFLFLIITFRNILYKYK